MTNKILRSTSVAILLPGMTLMLLARCSSNQDRKSGAPAKFNNGSEAPEQEPEPNRASSSDTSEGEEDEEPKPPTPAASSSAEPLATASPTPSPTPSPTSDTGVNDNRTPLFRLRNNASGFLFFTTSPTERNGASQAGYTDVTGTRITCLYSAAAANRVVLYRLYNSEVGHHFYTTKLSEALTMLSMRRLSGSEMREVPVWVIESLNQPEGYLFSMPVEGANPVFRLYNATINTYLITGSGAEKGELLDMLDGNNAPIWTDQGVLGYAKACP